MVRLLTALISDNRVQLLELAGVVLLCIFVALMWGALWILLICAIAALLKSAEIDAKGRGGRQ